MTMPGFLTTIFQLLVILLLCVAATNGSSQCPVTTSKKNLKPLHILTLLPISRRRSPIGRESLSHIAGARIAQSEINRRKDILPGYHLETIVKSTGRKCATSLWQLTNTGLDTMVKYTVNPPCPPLVAVNGLSCTLQTSFLSYVAEKHRLDLIHFATTRFQTRSAKANFTRLWRIIDSGAVYADAVLSIMDKFDWNRIAIAYDRNWQSLRAIASRIRTRVLSSSNKEVLFTASVQNVYREEKYREIVQLLKERAGRVLIIVLSPKKSAELLCRLASKRLVYPAFIAILVDKWKVLNLEREVQCNKSLAIKAGHGHIYLSIPRQSTAIKNSTILVSKSTYGKFRMKFGKEFAQIRKHYKAMRMHGLIGHASVSHDETWAIALAINNSLQILKSKNLSIDSYTIGEHETTSVIAEELARLNFQGASGHIKFTNRHVPHEVKIRQVNRTVLQEIGSYTPIVESDNVTYKLYLSIDSRSVPDDVPVVAYSYVVTSPIEVIVFYVAAGLTILFTTLILGLLFYYRESREVKAISPYLSIVIIIGCYLVSASAIVVTVQGHLEIDPNLLFMLELTSIMMHDFGTYLIYATLALKLLRIMHIFTTWKVKCAILWKDISLALIAIGFSLLAFINLIVIVTGFVMITIKKEIITTEDTISSRITVKLQIHNPILTCIKVSKGIILFIILCLSTSTRRIDREQFKNTKKVNLLLLLLIFFDLMINPVFPFYNPGFVALGSIVSVVLVHALLFLPNIASACSQRRRKKHVQKKKTVS